MTHRSLLATGLLLAAAACGSTENQAPVRDPSVVAPPTEAELARKAGELAESGRDGSSAALASGSGSLSSSRPLAYVNGDVITYREILLRVGPQLSALRSDSERHALEEQTLMQAVRSKMIYQAAVQASVGVRTSEVERQIQDNIRSLERSGGTLEAYLRERGMTRREYEDTIRRELIAQIYMYAATGRGGTPRVRPRAETYVMPEEVEQYYERNPELFREPATARVRMLAVKPDFLADDRQQAVREARRQCDQARERLLAGEDWVPVFRSVVDAGESTAPLDGLLTIRQGEGSYAPWIEEFGFTQEEGTLSDVIQQGSTFVLLYSEGATEARTVPFEEVRDDVRRRLSQVKWVLASQEVELQLLEEASVQPEQVRERLRQRIRLERRKLLQEAGL